MERIYLNLEENLLLKTKVNNSILLSDIVNNYLDHVLTYNTNETYKCYYGHLKIINDYFIYIHKCKYDNDICRDMIYDFIKFQREKRLSNSTINKRINVFKRALKFSNSSLNISNINSLKEKYITFEYLRDNEINILIDYIDKSNMSIKNKLIVSLFLESGVRRKELMKIKLRNIDAENKIIFLDFTKGNDSRFIMYDDLTDKYLKMYLKDYDLDNEYLFDITAIAIDSIFKRIKKILKLKKFSPYVLRHTYATIIANNDGNIEMLKNTMGHKKLSTTQRYIHYNTKLLRKSYDKSFKLK